MNKKLMRYPDVVAVRLTLEERTKLDQLVTDLNTSKSTYLRKKIKRMIKSIKN